MPVEFDVDELLCVNGSQMVMEFPDSILDVEDHETNPAQWKQFSEVSSSNFYTQFL